jgi:hypothetical protein
VKSQKHFITVFSDFETHFLNELKYVAVFTDKLDTEDPADYTIRELSMREPTMENGGVNRFGLGTLAGQI